MKLELERSSWNINMKKNDISKQVILSGEYSEGMHKTNVGTVEFVRVYSTLLIDLSRCDLGTSLRKGSLREISLRGNLGRKRGRHKLANGLHLNIRGVV